MTNMNYYIQGDAAKAEQIKAAFERLGYDTSFVQNLFTSDSHILFTLPCDSRVHAFHTAYIEADVLKRLVDIDPDYQELEPLHNFKKGDLLVHNSSNTRIISVVDVSEKYGYQVQDGGSRHHLSFNVIENEYHLWSIKDAKDGDVLVTTKIRNCPFIYRKTDYNNDLAYYYAGVDGNGDFCEGCLKRTLYHFGPVENVVPATKEQRDLLFQKIKEAGYTWDGEKKELKKIQPHYDISNFKPFDKVLVRDDDTDMWTASLYSNYDKITERHFVTIDSCYSQCIPFNGNEHLLGDTDMCDEQYINW